MMTTEQDAVIVTGSKITNLADAHINSADKMLTGIEKKMPQGVEHGCNYRTGVYSSKDRLQFITVTFMVRADNAEESMRLAEERIIPAFEKHGFDAPLVRRCAWSVNELIKI